jgi:hypothetical protein
MKTHLLSEIGIVRQKNFERVRPLACILLCTALSAAPPARFAEHTVATGLTGGYQVVAVDMNHDGKLDLVALASGMTELVWFENPGWQRHVIAQNLSGMINLAAWDVDGDGIPEIVLASGFSMNAKSSAGIVSVLRHNGDPRQPWTIREIDRLPTSHRLRWADIDGSGKKVLVNQPLTAATVDTPKTARTRRWCSTGPANGSARPSRNRMRAWSTASISWTGTATAATKS